ncbi:MAG: sterol desaturase family protein, partial [Gammaproteobacteria bacterium]|nr:sterol desaturase family protein [Gammaproteobacteria bacterium]
MARYAQAGSRSTPPDQPARSRAGARNQSPSAEPHRAIHADPMNETNVIRFGIFAAALGTMLIWEWIAPFRGSPERKWIRLRRHISLMAINFLALRALSGGGAYAIALLAEAHHWGLMAAVAWPEWLRVALGLALMDFAIYAQHVIFHKVPLLWCLHKVHHSDVDFDTTTAIRF